MILPCPFCGEIPVLQDNWTPDTYRHPVVRGSEYCPCTGVYAQAEEWNARYDDREPIAEADAAEKFAQNCAKQKREREGK